MIPKKYFENTALQSTLITGLPKSFKYPIIMSFQLSRVENALANLIVCSILIDYNINSLTS